MLVGGPTRGKITVGRTALFRTTCISVLTLPNVREEAMTFIPPRKDRQLRRPMDYEIYSQPRVRSGCSRASPDHLRFSFEACGRTSAGIRAHFRIPGPKRRAKV